MIFLTKTRRLVDARSGRCRVETNRRDISDEMQRFLEEARANAGPAMPGIDQNHRNPGKGSAVSNRGDGADHIALMVECDTAS
jgi:hypothetical protein